MIVLIISAAEAQTLINKRPDRSLQEYLAAEIRMERLLPDDRLPRSVTLQQIDCDGRNYAAVVTYETAEEADQAWEAARTPDLLQGDEA